MIKPRRLEPGNVVAVVSPSWGGPALRPATFEAGVDTLARPDQGLALGDTVSVPRS